MVPWFLNNVACNSLATISNIEIGSLELQRLWAVLKTDLGELHATFWGAWRGLGTRPAPALVPAPASVQALVPVPWFLNNVARNSLAIISDFEIASLELQRLWAMSKNDRVKLRATFLGETPERGRA